MKPTQPRPHRIKHQERAAFMPVDLSILDAQNRPRDHVFIGRRVRVTIKPYAYWARPIDRMGVGLGLRRIGVHVGEAYDGQAR